MASIVTSMLMLAIGRSIAAGIGIAGGLSIIRFRTTMRDPRDMVFVFAALAVGIAAGLRAYSAAIVGTLVFAVAAVVLHWLGYGAHLQYDGLLRLFAPPNPDVQDAVGAALRRFCQRYALVTMREAAQGDVVEHAYQVSLVDRHHQSGLVAELRKIPGVEDVTLLLQDPTLEL